MILELEKLWLSRNVEIRTDIPGDLPKVFADQRRMRQVLLNLLENALKYTGEGGHITLTMFHRTSQRVEVSVCDGIEHPGRGATEGFWTGSACPRPPIAPPATGWAWRSAAESLKCMAVASG